MVKAFQCAYNLEECRGSWGLLKKLGLYPNNNFKLSVLFTVSLLDDNQQKAIFGLLFLTPLTDNYTAIYGWHTERAVNCIRLWYWPTKYVIFMYTYIHMLYVL